MLHDLEIVVSLDCIANDGVKTFQCIFICCDVGSDAGLGVQVKGTLRHLQQEIQGIRVKTSARCDSCGRIVTCTLACDVIWYTWVFGFVARGYAKSAEAEKDESLSLGQPTKRSNQLYI